MLPRLERSPGRWEASKTGVMRRNVLEEILDPLDDGERRNIDVANPYFFIRHPATKRVKAAKGPRSKQYGLIFNKRVVDSTEHVHVTIPTATMQLPLKMMRWLNSW